ncbi:MAG: hypothetical protein HOD60_01115 [Candidatus Nitrosopelagicus sp.]|nr:hypothetical protein [Candidatus Nitrosopelagicus sp.]
MIKSVHVNDCHKILDHFQVFQIPNHDKCKLIFAFLPTCKDGFSQDPLILTPFLLSSYGLFVKT